MFLFNLGFIKILYILSVLIFFIILCTNSMDIGSWDRCHRRVLILAIDRICSWWRRKISQITYFIASSLLRKKLLYSRFNLLYWLLMVKLVRVFIILLLSRFLLLSIRKILLILSMSFAVVLRWFVFIWKYVILLSMLICWRLNIWHLKFNAVRNCSNFLKRSNTTWILLG
jgi:hypothetical protein